MLPNYEYNYQRPKVLFNGHIETIYPALFRKVTLPTLPVRERITTVDDDFLDIDWYRNGKNKVVILQHGLEGSSDRPYILGMARAFLLQSFDVCAWNFRGCSGEVNKAKIFYHSGATYDLENVVNHASKEYDQIFLVGFSLGGNLTLKYLGE
ncbi:MAG: alpha/beta fold hydrolase, partial [Cyclobacteriaceae bacterium]